MAAAALRRLGLLDRPVEVVLGGGILAAGHPRLSGRVAAGFADAAPRAVLRAFDGPPVAGAAIHALGVLHREKTGTIRDPDAFAAARARLLAGCGTA